MKQTTSNLLRYPGFVFMIVCTILFYNQLFAAAGNPKFFVFVYFDMFNEGLFELAFFIVAIPFIATTIVLEALSFRREKDGNRNQSNTA